MLESVQSGLLATTSYYYNHMYYEKRYFVLEMCVVLSSLTFIASIWFFVCFLLAGWIYWYAGKNNIILESMSELFSYIKNSAVASGVSAGVYLSFCFLLAITTNKQKPYVRVIGLEIYLILHGMYSETIISIIREQMSKWGYGESIRKVPSREPQK